MAKKLSLKKFISLAILAIIAIVIAIFPFIAVNDYHTRVMIVIFIYVIASAGLNLVSGVAGQVSMGAAGFFVLGAYTSTLLVQKADVNVFIAMFAALLLNLVVGFGLGILAMRLSGGYLAVLTLSFAEAIRLLIINLEWLTNGNVGLVAILRPNAFGFVFSSYKSFYYLTLAFTVILMWFMYNLINSNYGLRLKMIKNDEIASQTSGVNILRDKVIAFAVSAAYAGFSGSIYAHFMKSIDPAAGANTRSNLFLCMVVLGGMGSMWGTVVAAFILALLPEVLRGFDEYNQLIYGFILVIAMLLRSQNIDMDTVKAKVSSMLHKKAKEA